MKPMLAYCGLTCNSCPIHLATLEQDNSRKIEMRISIARLGSELYGMNMQPEDISDCDGCMAKTGRLFSGCMQCEIRKCASQRNIESCAYCVDFACDRLKEFFNHDPEAAIRLDALRSNHNLQ